MTNGLDRVPTCLKDLGFRQQSIITGLLRHGAVPAVGVFRHGIPPNRLTPSRRRPAVNNRANSGITRRLRKMPVKSWPSAVRAEYFLHFPALSEHPFLPRLRHAARKDLPLSFWVVPGVCVRLPAISVAERSPVTAQTMGNQVEVATISARSIHLLMHNRRVASQRPAP